jgi:predicted 2-oxoglutarate/Fe(II)-dependent dioxygenase YbiX
MIDYNEGLIVHVKNFVTPDKIKVLNDYLDSMEVKKFKDVFYFNGSGDEYKNQTEIKDASVIEKMNELDLLIKDFIKDQYLKKTGFELSKYSWTRPLELVRWRVNSFLAAHSDGSDEPEDFPLMKIGSLIYLNDEYEGGELYFNDYKITIKPNPGDLVIFPNHYMHEVFMVLGKGENTRRHTMPTFYCVELKGDSNE